MFVTFASSPPLEPLFFLSLLAPCIVLSPWHPRRISLSPCSCFLWIRSPLQILETSTHSTREPNASTSRLPTHFITVSRWQGKGPLNAHQWKNSKTPYMQSPLVLRPLITNPGIEGQNSMRDRIPLTYKVNHISCFLFAPNSNFHLIVKLLHNALYVGFHCYKIFSLLFRKLKGIKFGWFVCLIHANNLSS